MRFVRTWSYGCADYLTLQLKESHGKRRVFYFGFQVIIGAIVKAALLVTISLLLGSLIPALIILLVFGSLRTIAGGYHMNTYGKCVAVSLALFITAAVLTRYTYTYWEYSHIMAAAMITFISGLAVILKWAPSDTPNRPITKPDEIKKFKMLSVLYIIIWMVLVSLIAYLKLDSYRMIVLSACFGVLLEAFTISPLGHRFFSRLSGKVDRIIQ